VQPLLRKHLSCFASLANRCRWDVSTTSPKAGHSAKSGRLRNWLASVGKLKTEPTPTPTASAAAIHPTTPPQPWSAVGGGDAWVRSTPTRTKRSQKGRDRRSPTPAQDRRRVSYPGVVGFPQALHRPISPRPPTGVHSMLRVAPTSKVTLISEFSLLCFVHFTSLQERVED